MEIRALDHVALWTSDRDGIASFVAERLGAHVVDRTDAFTLVGADARRGKLTLFAAEGPRERGALKHLALRVRDLPTARESLPHGADSLDLPDGLRLRLVGGADVELDLDHVALYSRTPEETASRYRALGFESADPGEGGVPRVAVRGAFVEFHRGDPSPSDRPLLNHLGMLVESADDHLAEAQELGLEVADVVDAPNTRSVFVWGPEGVKIEYVEHKPTFSLV